MIHTIQVSITTFIPVLLSDRNNVCVAFLTKIKSFPHAECYNRNVLMAQLYYFLGHEQYQPEILVKHAQLAEAAGFDGIMVSEHFHPWVADLGSAGFALATLGAIAAKTTTLQLMTGVITPLFRYHPAVVAQAAATLDRLSNGRFSLGVGTGESINETPLGITFPAYAERSERIREAITIITKLLHGEKLDFEGKYYQTHHAKLYSPPLHPVPVLLAAGGIKSGFLAGEIADGLIVSVKNPEDTLQNIVKPAIQEATSIHKQDFNVVASRWSIFAHDSEEAWKALGPWRGLRAPSRNRAVDPAMLQMEADMLSKDDILANYTIISSAEEYIAAYRILIETVHANIVVIQTAGILQERIIVASQ